MCAIPICRRCKELLTDKNWYPSDKKGNSHICIDCQKAISIARRGTRNEYHKKLHEDPSYWAKIEDNHICSGCGVLLTEANWIPSRIKHRIYMCRICAAVKSNTWRDSNPERTEKTIKDWNAEHPESRKMRWTKSNIRRRGFPPLKTVLGKKFKGAHLHHMSEEVGMWVPEVINRIPHCLKTGKNMEKVNTVAWEWYSITYGRSELMVCTITL